MKECLIVWNETGVIFSQKEQRAWVATFVIEFIVIFLLNAFTLAIYIRNRHLRKRSTYLIINLTVVDLLVGTVAGPSIIGSLSKDVFERRTSTGNEAFSLFICLDANRLVLLSFFSPLKTIYPRVSTKTLPNDAKSALPVDVRRSTTLLLKLPNIRTRQPGEGSAS